MEENGLSEKTENQWRVLEFYSGIGGMRYSLMKGGINAKVVEAFDINDKANDVYQHNFGHRPYQGNIQCLSASDLDSYGAHSWLLSPPCQPYTRQGLQKGSEDARASSFLTILDLIPQTLKPPLMLFVENVVGFEKSDTHRIMIEILQKNDFVTQEFILSPLQFGVPYSRPRYFLLAKRKPSSFGCFQYNNQLLVTSTLLFGHENILIGENELQSCESVARFLEVNNSSNQIENNIANVEENNKAYGSDGVYTVPLSLIERWGSAMDIVYPESKRCCCFTKSYYRYVKGTGSLLATVQPKHTDKVSSLKEQGLRYFTPREVANLHSFPEDFQFPHFISLRQRYALLGNSLSVSVVAPLLQYLFDVPR